MAYATFTDKDIMYKDKEELFKKTGISITDPILPPKKLITLTGKLSDFKSILCWAPLMGDAYMSEEQRQKQKSRLRAGAAAAMLNGNSVSALAGLGRADGGQNRNDYAKAQYFTAKLNGSITLKGWIGFYKFCEGDEVEVVAEQHEDHYEVYAMLKPSEQIICIIPPCYSGHKYLFKDFLWCFFLIYFLFTMGWIALFRQFTFKFITGSSMGLGILFGVTTIIALYNIRKTFMTLAEQIFTTLGWQNVEYINLRKMTKAHIDELIKEGKYSLEWDELKDTWIRPARKSSRSAVGLFYYQPKVVFKKKSPDNLKSSTK